MYSLCPAWQRYNMTSLQKTRAIAAFFLAALTKTRLQLLYSRVSLKHGYRLNLQLCFLKNAAICQLQLRFSKCGYRSSQIIFFKGDLQLRFLKMQLQPTYSCVFFLKNAAISQLQLRFSKCGYRSSQIIFFKGDLQLRFLKTQLQPTYSCVFFLINAAISQLQPRFYNADIGPVK